MSKDNQAIEIAGNQADGTPKIILVDSNGKVLISLASDSVAAAIKAKTDLIPADIVTQLDTNIPAIKTKTDLIPADIVTQLDTNIPAIKAKTDALPSFPTSDNAVFLDATNGVAGTAWPIGTSTNPVSNVADALTIMAARKLDTLVLVGSGTITFASTADINIIGNREYNIIVNDTKTLTTSGDLVCRHITLGTFSGTGAHLKVHGNLEFKYMYVHTLCSWTVYGNVVTEMTDSPDIYQDDQGSGTVFGSVWMNSFTVLDGAVHIIGDLHLAGQSNITGAQVLAVYGDLISNTFNPSITVSEVNKTISVRRNLIFPFGVIDMNLGTLNVGGHAIVKELYNSRAQNDSATAININGDLMILGVLSYTNTQGVTTIGGRLIDYGTKVTGGTITFKGEQSTVAVNITAIAASETSVFDLTALANNTLKYEVSNLVLKSADPGANTVNVRLYELVNGTLTNTKTFAITTANYASYFNLPDLFVLQRLKGTAVKITVQATAGGPYAVTGQYEYNKGKV